MRTVLVVDDSGAAEESLGPLFARAELQAVYVSSAVAALERYEAGDIAIVLSEVHLPRVDGLVLARKLRRRDPEAVIVLMTAIDRNAELLAAIKVGVFDFFVKPFAAADFVDSLQRAVDWRTRLRSKTAPAVPAFDAAAPALDPAREAALQEREARVAEREAAFEQTMLEWEAMGGTAPGAASAAGEGENAEQAAALAAREAEVEHREAALAEREAFIQEREAFIEESENALFEKGQRLQEYETELDHRAEGIGPDAPPAPASVTTPGPAPGDEAWAEREAALAERENTLEARAAELAERERRLKKNEALIEARERYLRQSENILFERED